MNKSVDHPHNTKNLALKPLNGSTFGCKKERATLKFCLPGVYTHHMRYARDICTIQEVFYD